MLDVSRLGEGLLTFILTAGIQPVEASLEGAGGYSFPSGHTARAAANWGAQGYSLCKDTKEKYRKVLGGIAWGIVIFINYHLPMTMQ